MASFASAKDTAEEPKISRKRKRAMHPDIPSNTPSLTSTPGVVSQAPRGINAAEFAEARALEIQNMVQAIQEADNPSGKRLHQVLPRHMRRRAMSHNVKRMPVRLRYRAALEMNNPANRPEFPKKKSRRHRRQPKNLLEEYTRRQRKHVWLETHIWHAKRMKMIDAWGYRLAEHPNDKGFRATYRAARNSCLLQDISYYGCIEVSGVQSLIIQAMSHLTSQETGLTMGAKYFLDGSKEGHVTMYKNDQYPFGVIGPVSFLWRQTTRTDSDTITNNMHQLGSHTLNVDDCEEKEHICNAQKSSSNEVAVENSSNECHRSLDKEVDSQLWIWSHPACFHSVFVEIVEACKSVGQTSVKEDIFKDPSDEISSEQDASVSGGSLVNGDSLVPDAPVLTVTSRRFDLLRFRLTGPQSHALLAATLRLPSDLKHKDATSENSQSISQSKAKKFVNNIQHNAKDKCLTKWWQNLPKLGNDLIWDNLKGAWSPSVFPPGCVIGLTVLDPRLNLPDRKTSVSSVAEEVDSAGMSGSNSLTDASCESDISINGPTEADSIHNNKGLFFESVITQWPLSVARSHIWDESVRVEVKESKVPEQELNRKKSELLLPGSHMNLDEEEISHVPILLIQQPGYSSTCNSRDPGAIPGYGSGWDVILPSGWAMAFWIAFVYRGARTGGLKESQTLALEQGAPFFPNDFPDSPAGDSYNTKLRDDGEAQYARYPPAKRPNYDKLGVKSPFNPPWRQLVEEWSAREEASIRTQPAPNHLSINSLSGPSCKDTSLSNVSDPNQTSINSQSRLLGKDVSLSNASAPNQSSIDSLSRPTGKDTSLSKVSVPNQSSIDSLSRPTGKDTSLSKVSVPNQSSIDSLSRPTGKDTSLSKVSVPNQSSIDSLSRPTDKDTSLSNTSEGELQTTRGGSFYVLRARSHLSVLRSCLQRCKQPLKASSKQHGSLCEVTPPVNDLSLIARNNPSSLALVSLRMVNRGTPLPNSSVAIPSREDIKRLKKCKDYVGPVEPLHKGTRPNKSLKSSCQREIVGFVSSGHFCLSRGCGFGVAFCALPGLVKLLSSNSFKGEVVVLVRSPANQQYRFAYLSIL